MSYSTTEISNHIEFESQEEWLEFKNHTIGGSEAAAILGKSKWMTSDDIYNKIVLGKAKRIPSNPKMENGTKAESHIRSLFALDTGYEVVDPPKGNWLFFREEKPYSTVSPDGLFRKENGRWWGLEIKYVDCIKTEEKEIWLNNKLPDQYYIQCLKYLLDIPCLDGVVLKAHLKLYKKDEESGKWLFDYALDLNFQVIREEVESELEYLEKKEDQFYNENILKRKRPKTIIRF